MKVDSMKVDSMLVESIHNKPPNSQSNQSKHSTSVDLASRGYFKLDLHRECINFIKRFEPFVWFSTLTFQYSTHPEACEKAFKRWIVHINESLYGRRFREHKQGVCWIRALEFQRREVAHFHCLLGSLEFNKLLRDEAVRDYFAQAWVTDIGRKLPSGEYPKRFKAVPNRFDRVADLTEPTEVDSIINGYAFIKEYDPRGGAVNYLSKYIFKGGEVDYFVPPEQRHLLNDSSPMLGTQFVN